MAISMDNQLEVLMKNLKTGFDDDTIEVHDETTANDIEDWDSFEHINLVIAVEKKFNVKFTVGEANEMKNVGEMVDIILERMPK